MHSDPILVLDNGASTIKATIVSEGNAVNPRIIPNAVVRSKGDKRTYFGHELEQCADFASLHYRLPFERGIITDWDAQKAIWDSLFSKDCLDLRTPASSLIITEPYFNLPNIQEVYDQFAFEEYEFQSYYRATPASFIPHGSLFSAAGEQPPECLLIIDSGFSFTHVIPIVNGTIVWKGVRRLDVGGKLLTNHLKELVSFRQWNMMDETYIVNDVKEKCCYVSNAYEQDMETSHAYQKGPLSLEYILPDFSKNRRGRVRQQGEPLGDADQVLHMNNERFAVSEVLFWPSHVGLDQEGLPALIATSISSLPSDLQGLFWASIGLIGGNAYIPGFRERLLKELRCLAPEDCQVRIHESGNAILEAHQSAVSFALKGSLANYAVTRAEYLESGSNACRRKFRDWRTAQTQLDMEEPPEGATYPEGEKDKEKEKEKTVGRPKGKSRARDPDDEVVSNSGPNVKKSSLTTTTRTRSVRRANR